MPFNPTQTDLTALRDAIAAREVAVVDVVRAYLDRIARAGEALGAINEVYAERALAEAEAIDAELAQGRSRGPLTGVPIVHKDNLCTDWGHTTCSSRMLSDFKAPYTATAVRRLIDAGAIVLAKTRMDEFAMGSSCETCARGVTMNPWDVTRVPGGSSGGSAAATAADLASASLGSDTGGSIRQPAALCGIVGFKPTYGTVSRYGLVAFASSLDQIGPMTRSVRDAALLYGVMAGAGSALHVRDPRDATSVDWRPCESLLDLTPALDDAGRAVRPDGSPLRIGLAGQYLNEAANDPAVTAALHEAIAVYRDAGAEIVDVDLPHTDYGISVYYIVATAEASSNLARYDGVHYGHRAAEQRCDDLIDLYATSRAEGFGDEVKRRIMLGTYALSSGYYDALYNRALKVRRLVADDFDKAFEACDAILCPTAPTPAFRIGEKTDDPLTMYLNDVYTVNANLAGIPGVSLPGGFAQVGDGADGKRLPVGVQLFGPAFGEAELLRVAMIHQQATDHWTQRPPLDLDALGAARA